MVYVGNYIVVEHDRQAVCKAATVHRVGLESTRLPTHKIADDISEVDFIGLHFNSDSHEVRLSWALLWRLRAALLYVDVLGAH